MWSIARAAGREDGSATAPPLPKPAIHRWYLGGVASAAAAACTHPLDLLKVSVSDHEVLTLHRLIARSLKPIHISQCLTYS